ncbi:peptidase, M28 family [Purpureocillium lilacinum]|uniref:Peptidase, M28 family n=1 Tax=Purpureocillium lilacinum TaxID=33203 RepID=A0A179H0K3_PURLI|nr:peptidase, M28 family [Purpureocillium lilacinum]OAQ83238.1 peptidase, M28 family [Purpureocillium lilacinum]
MGKLLPSKPDKMANESTPLIQTVRVGPPRRRYPHQTCRRFCTLACTCVLIFGFISFALHAFLLWPYHRHHGHHSHHALSRHNGKSLSHDKLKSILLDTPSAKHAREWSQYYTSGPHLAGKNLSQAEWTRDKWQGWGVNSEVVAYDVYINYPVDHSLSLLSKSEKAKSWTVDFKATLTEDVLEEDPTTALDNRVPTFHGYSASGNVTASFVYVNYGTYRDFEDLVEAGIDLKGKIAIAKYGGVFRGLKVKRAQELGMVGTLIYSDPGDDGKHTEENGYKPYPDGPARNPSSVQRGSVQFLSVRPGDPSTPGYPSKPGAPRAPVHDSTPSIPSIPISYADAIPILKALNGYGPNSTTFNKYWNRNLGLAHKGVRYNIGPSPDNVVLNLYNEQEYTTTPLWDVIGVVNGTIPNEVIVVGNHRDAWIAGGAADPNSGSAILNEVIRSVGKAVDAGWKPLRTIVFGSWDGEEYGLVGSTEWVEEFLPWISDANVAYINVDVGASGPQFEAASAPLLNKVLREATKMVLSPNQTTKGQTVGDVWDGKIRTMGSGSDFTAFQDFAGVPCIDMGFKAAPESPVYQYHSNYDSFYWMDKYGDPGFKYHEAMAQVLGVLLGELSNTIVIPFGATEYADALDGYLDQVEDRLKAAREPTSEADIFALRGALTPKEVTGSADAFEESLRTVRRSLVALRVKAAELDDLAAWANRKLDDGIPWWNIIGKIKLWITIAKVNVQYKYFERHFLFEGGLDSRSWFKHVVFAPGLWTGYAGAVYPGLMESIDAKDYNNGLKWAGIIDRCVVKATHSIK